MEPVTVTAIVTALTLGAIAGLQETAKQVVKEAYASLKAIIQRKYSKVNLKLLEEMPESKDRQVKIAEDLTQAGAEYDEELLNQAKILLKVIQKDASEIDSAIGVHLDDIKGASLRISNVIATGTGIKATHANIGGDIEIKDIRTGQQGGELSKKS